MSGAKLINVSYAGESEVDLHIGARSVIVWLFLLSMALAFGARFLPDPAKMTTFVPFLWAFLVFSWLLESWNPPLGCWLLVIGLIAGAHVTAMWFELPSALVLVALPVALAIPLIGIHAGVALASAETAVFVLLRPFGSLEVETGLVIVTLVAMWLACGLMIATQRSVSELARWSVTNFQRARVLLDEARDRQAELKEALDALANANRQLALTYDKLAAARQLAEEARKTKAAFVANVSHEFRTPLNMIVGLVDMILETPDLYGEELPVALMKDLEIVGRNCEHLSSMINDVLDLSRIESGRPALHRENVCLQRVIEQALEVVRPLTEKKGLSLQAIIPDDLPEVYCDQTRIRQVILNLVSNAARFTEKGSIVVQAASEDEFVSVSVKDTGPGISLEDAKRIFEPFYQGATLVHRSDGTGLGLSISKQFVELHGGKMWVESQIGVGSTFSFKLPISPPPEPIARPERWITPGWVERRYNPNLPEVKLSQRIIVCDDTGELCSLFSRCEDQVEFVCSRDLPQAIAEMRRCPAQTLVINGESLDSVGLLMERARKELPDTPILGCILPPKTELALAAGAADFLLKPVTRGDLLRTFATLGKPVRDVLIVDDDLNVLELFSRMIQANDPTVRVRTATSGQQALVEAHHKPPDVVLLDILMPDQDGWETLKAIKKEETLCDTPVIIISAQDPQDQPVQSDWLLATISGGIPISKFLHCLRGISSSLLRPA